MNERPKARVYRNSAKNTGINPTPLGISIMQQLLLRARGADRPRVLPRGRGHVYTACGPRNSMPRGKAELNEDGVTSRVVRMEIPRLESW